MVIHPFFALLSCQHITRYIQASLHRKMVEPSSDHELSDLAPVIVVSSRTAHESTAAEEDQSE
jgi:hypothetical protein